MSARMPVNTPEIRQINFASGNANVETLGTDNQTGQGFINLAAVNNINRIIFNAGNANQVGYVVIKRDGKEIRRIPTSLMRADQQGPYFPGFPLTIRGGVGTLQFYFVLTSGTAAANTITVVWSHSLVPVMS